ncbi:MAG: DUF881 domain-containing protein [Firmicutes bacterium]|nr:DUF881 domain-containing protein [Bacillota bacterium]
MVLGALMVFQFRTTSSIDKSVPFSREQELTIEKRQLEKDIQELQEEIADLAAKLNEAGKGHTEAAGALESELAKMKLYAGLVPVAGPGVEVILENIPDRRRPGGAPGIDNIRDDDLLKVVNDLRGAGAEAIVINGQRITATSEIRLAGNHINVNLTRLTPPYRVEAIGNAAALKSSMEIKGGLVEYLDTLGISVKVQVKDKVQIPAYTGAIAFEYAKLAQRR